MRAARSQQILMALVLVWFCALPTTSFLSPGQQDLTEYETRLEDINRQIQALRTRINRLDRQKASVLSQIAKMGFKKTLIRKEIVRYDLQIQKTNGELESLRGEIQRLEEKIEKEKDAVARVLVTLYKYGSFNTVELLLQVENLADLITENKNLSQLARHQNDLLVEYLKNLEDLRDARLLQKQKKEEVTGLLDESRGKSRELDEQEKAAQNLIARITSDQTQFQEALKEKNAQARELQDLIDRLSRKEFPQEITIMPMFEKKGALPWPIEGRVLTTFGVKSHPRFKTRTVDNGIEIAGKENMVVRSVHPGFVAFSDYVQGYGNLMIIDHGMAYHSLYGHCAEFLAKRGDAVQANQPIAIVGDIDSLHGLTLYFEIRHQTKPVDPLHWLRRR